MPRITRIAIMITKIHPQPKPKPYPIPHLEPHQSPPIMLLPWLLPIWANAEVLKANKATNTIINIFIFFPLRKVLFGSACVAWCLYIPHYVDCSIAGWMAGNGSSLLFLCHFPAFFSTFMADFSALLTMLHFVFGAFITARLTNFSA